MHLRRSDAIALLVMSLTSAVALVTIMTIDSHAQNANWLCKRPSVHSCERVRP